MFQAFSWQKLWRYWHNSNTVRKTNHSKAKIKSWENEKVTDFQKNIDEEKLYTFEQKLLTINILFPLQKINNRLPNLFLDLSILILLSGICEQLFKTDQPVFFGVVYIPPEYTKYSSEDAFSELQQELKLLYLYRQFLSPQNRLYHNSVLRF
jgi:hypothetical protein